MVAVLVGPSSTYFSSLVGGSVWAGLPWGGLGGYGFRKTWNGGELDSFLSPCGAKL